MMALDRSAKVLVVSIFALLCFASARNSSPWKTLSGSSPVVIANGGLSGLLPSQTLVAYNLAVNDSFADTVMFCDLQLTKDQKGLCRTDLRLENSTNIQDIFGNQTNSYVVNGKTVSGHFSIDYDAKQLVNMNSGVAALQTVSARPAQFDNLFTLTDPYGIKDSLAESPIWVNVQYPSFYEEHNLSAQSYLLSLSKAIEVDYISSPEVGLLQAIAPRITRSKTKIILRIMGIQDVDPSINQTYGSFLNNLTFVKTFADGILVHKDYIWPVDTNLYLQPPTSLVKDAHNAGLEIYAANFANDEFGMSYNYSYDPVREYLQFVYYNDFGVDGVLTDFCATAAEAIACYALSNDNASSNAENPIIISHNGASGDYPGSTDMAYKAAIRDGADYIDCSVQITKDGVPFCRESPNLLNGTTITSNSEFYPSRSTTVQGIGSTGAGIFTFDLTWKEIQTLTPNIFSPYGESAGIFRNPANKNVGKYLTLADFLEFAKSQENVNVIVDLPYVRAIAAARKIDIIEPTISVITKSGYHNIADRLLIKSDDSAVLRELKQQTKFKLVYEVGGDNVRIPDSAIKEIKEVADAVSLSRGSVFQSPGGYLTGSTDDVKRLHRQNISVFVSFLRNEFTTLAYDYLSDPTLEINSLVNFAQVDGLITDFPATAKAYLGNSCRRSRNGDDYTMLLVVPGELEKTLDMQDILPRPQAPATLNFSEPPLPPTKNNNPTPAAAALAPKQAFSPAPGGPGTSAAFRSRQTLLASLLVGFFVLLLNSI